MTDESFGYPIHTRHMTQANQIAKELRTAETALREGNNGKARVCSRRAVALATEDWLERRSQTGQGQDAMHHLWTIQHDKTIPQAIREAAERLQTRITARKTAPFTVDPVADARLIIDHLIPDTSEPPPSGS